MSEQANTQLVQEIYQAFGRGDLPAILQRLAADVSWTFHGPEAQLPWCKVYNGHDGVVGFFTAMVSTVDTLESVPEEFVAQGDTVVVLGRERQRVKRTGKEYAAPWVHVFRIKGGLVVSFREITDNAGAVAANS